MGFPEPPGGPPVTFPLEVTEPGPVYGWLHTAPPPRSAWQRWGRNAVLLALTAVSIFATGAIDHVDVPGHAQVLVIDVVKGLLLVVGLLSILTAHEMGHYLACRYYRVDATLPFFIPFPFSMAGTLGAFIRIRSRIPHRRALFDIGVAGPIAGFIVCLPVLWLGVQEATVQSVDPATLHASFYGITPFSGEPILFKLATWLARGPLPNGAQLSIGPLGTAGWFGLLVTGLNLMPIGQLDGGHVTYAVLRGKAQRISRIASWICVALIYFGLNWILWAILVRVLGRRHPSTVDDESPVGRGRVILAVVSLVIFALCFVPDPVVFSWRGFFEDAGLLRFLQKVTGR